MRFSFTFLMSEMDLVIIETSSFGTSSVVSVTGSVDLQFLGCAWYLTTGPRRIHEARAPCHSSTVGPRFLIGSGLNFQLRLPFPPLTQAAKISAGIGVRFTRWLFRAVQGY